MKIADFTAQLNILYIIYYYILWPVENYGYPLSLLLIK